MEQQQQQQHHDRPPAYSHTDPDTIVLPSAPQHDPQAPIQLPDIKSLNLPEANRFLANGAQHTSQWQLPLAHTVFSPSRSDFPRPSVEVASPMDTASVVSYDGNAVRAGSVMSMDDPETRMAAEALSALGNLDFTRSPSSRAVAPPVQQSRWRQTTSPQSPKDEPEPLLSLLTASHPWVGNTINGSLSAYETTKYYSPAFVRSSAEFVERNIGSPLSNTVGSISRHTGVEAGVRRYLGQRRPSDTESRPDTKRRRVKESPPTSKKDIEMGLPTSPPPPMQSHMVYDYRSRAGSQASFETLPAYDDNKTPTYEESTQERPLLGQRSVSHNWRTQLMITTSGLGAALSESSLRSLKCCLGILHSAFDHVATIANALQSLLADYERSASDSTTSPSREPQQENGDAITNGTSHQPQAAQHQQRSQLVATRISSLASDILKTVHSVVAAVNQYTGSALPENAAALVRRQILSLPHRMRTAESNAAASSDGEQVGRDGRRWLDFAKQCLEMIEQVNLVLGGTIGSAERWLESMGRKRRHSGTPMGSGGEEKGEIGGCGAMNGVEMNEKR